MKDRMRGRTRLRLPSLASLGGGYPEDKIFGAQFIRISLASILFQSANQIIMAVLPLYLKHLGHAPSVLGLATSLSSIGALLMRPISGHVADKRSKLLVIVPGVLALMAGVLGIGFLPYVVPIVAIRILQGAGISAATTSQYAIVADALPDSQMRKGLSYFGVCATIAGAAGPSIGLALIMGDNYMPAWIGSAAIFLASILILLTIRTKGAESRRRAVVNSVAAQSAAYRGLWRFFEKSALRPSAVFLAINLASSAVNVFLPVYAVEVGIANIGVFYVFQAASMFTANVLVGSVIHKARSQYAILLAFVACFGCSLVALYAAAGMFSFIVAAVLYGFGIGASTTTVSAIALSSTVPERRGAASATFQVAQDIGYFGGSLFGGIIAGAVGFRMLYGALVALPAVGVIVCLAFSVIDKRNRLLLGGMNVTRRER